LDEKAQFYVFEAIVAIVMILLSLLFVYTMSAPPTASPYSSTQLKILADEALYILKNKPASEGYIPAADSCVGRWDFEEGNGTKTNDTSGNDNFGTLYNDASFTNVSVHGEYAMDFDGTGDYVNIARNNISDIWEKFSISAWVKLNEHKNYSGITAGNGFVFAIANNGSIWARIYNNTTPASNNYYSIQNISLYAWTHVVITYDSTVASDNLKTYINKGLDNKTLNYIYAANNTGGDLIVGGSNPGLPAMNNFNGTIDDVCIWNRSLSWEEINTTYTLGLQSHFENILTQWIITNDNTSRNEFAANMSKMLPETVFYQVQIYDGINTYWWYHGEKREFADTTVRSHYIISHGTRVYDVELEMWRI